MRAPWLRETALTVVIAAVILLHLLSHGIAGRFFRGKV